jgi:tetratricopeptide (TPR) repeat protein
MNPGFSSSASLHDEGSYGVDVPVNPKRVKQDQSVARYYWNLKDWEGAYLRYKDALRFGPDNPDTLYGLAEAEAKLGKNISARQHYEQYLKVAPGGSKARDVAKAISKLPETDAPAKKGMGPVVP